MKRKILLAAKPGTFDRFHKYSSFFSGLLAILNVVPPSAYIDIP
jgi:hypothetical protein